MSYDAGILNDYGGGDVGWWHDYIRSLLSLADDYYQDEINRCEEESISLQAENKRLKLLMKGATLDYGYANGWGEEPLLVKECKEKGHKRNDRGLGHFNNIVWCDICNYQYKYDSS